ncbi:3-hydroxyacyl-CoA dehydrogenase/enoyl-CoA hydratase family protein [Hyphobacterium sp. CCMP332]|nr:3-hydroxyacyl-CoA dehydrogenase/enoyl-CoA hydratase family protein [Hyphobacterium sp. CCMP332]
MKRIIKKVAILGSGVMGSRIACHFANIGVQVLLLDMVPRELNDKEKKAGLDLENKNVRNRIVNDSLITALKSNPSPIYHKDFASRIETGNFDDDMSKIEKSDWVIEVVVENLEIKKKIFESVEKFRAKGTLITSNTSGIPMHLMCEGRTEDFQKNFAGTHFFNPPRYLQLLEIIPGPQSDPEVVDFLMSFGSKFLGKTTVLCKDTPAFIANRVGIYAILKVVDSMMKLGLNIDEVDKLTGPVIGRPKSATFRTSDVVGLDTLIKVSDNLYQGLTKDESREMFKLPEEVRKMEKNKWFGDKTKQGFYKKVKDEEGKSQILTLDLDSFEYKPKEKVKFATLEETKSIDKVINRFKTLLNGKDKAGEFYRDSFYGLFQYVSFRIPEIADHLYQIDQAVCSGFGWEVGPFETWDSVGLEDTIKKMEEAGFKVGSWVKDMLKKGKTSFYKVEGGVKKYYNIKNDAYEALPGTDEFIVLDNLRENKKVWSNEGATIFDIGDGILNIEFHTKMNTLGSEVIQGINKAIDLAEKEYEGLVIGNQGANFSAGANVGMIFMFAIEQEFDEIDFMVRQFQNTMMRVRYSSIPVVVAPHGLTLGGGCEMTMHADKVQAAAETYIGLVEMGIGVIPGGGGTKEMVLRVSDTFEEGDAELNNMQNAFMDIAQAKVATSAYEAFDMHILHDGDNISVNKNRQLADAKQAVISIIEQGYVQPVHRKDIKVQGKKLIALFEAGINGMLMGRYISEHDAKVARKLAYVMAGGDLSYPQEVSEQYLLDLEREAFVSLTGEKKTLERIQAVIKTGRPIRN